MKMKTKLILAHASIVVFSIASTMCAFVAVDIGVNYFTSSKAQVIQLSDNNDIQASAPSLNK